MQKPRCFSLFSACGYWSDVEVYKITSSVFLWLV